MDALKPFQEFIVKYAFVIKDPFTANKRRIFWR
jgi:hypothetical protein